MTSKRATYYYRRFNWEEINNMFCYDVKFPERLSKKQQILRLYKNSLRRVMDLEIYSLRPSDLENYSKGCHEIRNDFEKLKYTNDMKDIVDIQEKYENFIEKTYRVFPLFRDNVPYEWRHQKGLVSYPSNQIEFDPFGYYSPQSLDLYPKPREFEYRDELPAVDYWHQKDYSEGGWDKVNINDYEVKSNQYKEIKSPEQLKDYIEILKGKIGNQNKH